MTTSIAILAISLISVALFLAWGYASWKALPALTDIDGPIPGPVWLNTLWGQLLITGVGGIAAALFFQFTSRGILEILHVGLRMSVLSWAVLAILAALGFVVGRLFTGIAMETLVKLGRSSGEQDTP